MSPDPSFEQLRLVDGREDEFGARLRLQAVGHDLAPDPVNELRRRAIGSRLQSLQDLRLPAWAQLQVAIALGILGGGNFDRSREAAFDQIENLVVDSIELGSQCCESLQLFLGHCKSRQVAASRGGLRGQFVSMFSGRP